MDFNDELFARLKRIERMMQLLMIFQNHAAEVKDWLTVDEYKEWMKLRETKL